MQKKSYQPRTRFSRWLEERLPVGGFFYSFFYNFFVPRNLNYFYTFGGILTLMLLSQLLTGLVLAMHYVPHVSHAFASRQAFLRDTGFGWLFAPWHAVGASFFFIACYIHLARSLYYGSYKSPRELVWLLGVFLYLFMMAIAFFGYVLVWGMMSTTAASVISSFLKQIPLLGDFLYTLFVGGYSVGQPTLNRFYVWHYALTFLLLFFVALHIVALHRVGQGNPAGVVPRTEKDVMPFAPYAVIKDLFAISVFLLFFCWFLFYMPDYMGCADNYIPGDPMKTSAHIAPEWYFLPFYAMLRAITFDIGPIPSTAAGVWTVFLALFLLFLVPWLDRSPIYSARYRPLYKIFFWLFIGDVVFLGYLGAQEISDSTVIAAQCSTLYYFFFFLVVLPCLPYFEKCKAVPVSIEETLKRPKSEEKGLW